MDVSTNAPTNGQILKWNGTNWTPADDNDTTYSAGTGLDLTGNVFSLNSGIDNLTDVDVSTNAPTNGQILKWNGTNWTPADDNNTTYTAGTGLDLTGNVFSLNSGIDNLTDVDVTTNTPTNGQVLKWNGTNWVPSDDSGAQILNDLADAKSDNDGSQNGSSVFVGLNAGINDDETDNQNTGIGYAALQSNINGTYNFAGGHQALYNNTGSYNTAVGKNALFSLTTGSYNTAVGSYALYKNIGQYNTALGEYAYFTSLFGTTNFDNSTALGYFTIITASNQIRLGNNSVSSIGGYTNWTNVSDARFKKDVRENVVGLPFIMKLRPVTYRLDMDAIAKFNKTPDSLRLPEAEKQKAAELQTGFIAQEVEQAARSVGYDFHGVDKPKNENDYYGLRYAEFVVPLVKAAQEQQKMLEKKQKEIDKLKQTIQILLHKKKN